MARARGGRRRSTPAAWSWRPGSSTSTRTCASPATRMPRPSPRGSRRRPTAGSRPSARCRTRRPALDEPGVLSQIRAAAAASGSPVELLAHGAVTMGRAGETLAALGELADAGVVGFSDDGSPVRSASILRNALAYAGSLGLPIVDHPEDATLTDGAEANDGFVATSWGCAAGRAPPRKPPSGAISRSSPTCAGTCRAPDCTSPTSRRPVPSTSCGGQRPPGCR